MKARSRQVLLRLLENWHAVGVTPANAKAEAIDWLQNNAMEMMAGIDFPERAVMYFRTGKQESAANIVAKWLNQEWSRICSIPIDDEGAPESWLGLQWTSEDAMAILQGLVY